MYVRVCQFAYPDWKRPISERNCSFSTLVSELSCSSELTKLALYEDRELELSIEVVDSLTGGSEPLLVLKCVTQILRLEF